MTLRIVLMLTVLLLTLSCAQAATGPWRIDHIITTFWCPPPATDEALAAVAAQHYTLTWTPADGLDVAARRGLRAMLQDPLLNPATLDDPAQTAKLDALIARVKNHRALYAYFLTDEPSAAAFPGWGRLVAYLRERDPAHLAYINLFPTYANNEQLGTTGDTVTAYQEHLRQYIAVVKPALISYDHYHFFMNKDGDQYFLNLGMIRRAALDAGLPFLNIIQACKIDKSWRLPNPDELRWLVYTTLAYGGRGISYFVYWGPASYGGLYQDGKRMPLALAAAKLNGEIGDLSPILMTLDSLGVYHTAPAPQGAEAIPADAPVQIVSQGEFVLGLFGKGGKVTAFMLVNGSYRQAATARLRLPPGKRAEGFDKVRRGWRGYAETSGTITVRLRPGDGRLFRLVR
jgi:hypothetical protein